MTKLLLTYFVTLICFLVIDMIWLQGVAKSFYAQQLTGLLRPKPIIWAAALFYFVYPLGLTIFGILRAPDPSSLGSVAMSAALFGFFAYLTYDATNYAVAKDFPLTIAIVDTLWGTFASALTCVASAFILAKLMPATS
jgi:uncharacterized membrane protein